MNECNKCHDCIFEAKCTPSIKESNGEDCDDFEYANPCETCITDGEEDTWREMSWNKYVQTLWDCV